ncbi:MAG: DUF1343 domain-containing protein [Opitutaceae bacterium]|nr:DUF1343 domain-containing protein [Opitutaceae bacterium]MBP9914030.1 DUF1343 domain-containing protein [Opitutaceae bacterium]
MSGENRFLPLKNLLPWFVLALGLFGCSASQPPPRQVKTATPVAPQLAPAPAAAPAAPFPIMLGIDVLESQGFAAVKGKRIGLLTHPAGVNRRGESTIDVLRRAPGVRLVALFGPEHGIYGDEKAEVFIPNRVDKRTGLPVYSLYGKDRKPTKPMLKDLDAMVIDLQDIGTRSYTYSSSMLYTMGACFENNVEVIVLDRPNPLGGYKADGPPLDPQWKSYVGAFRVPYVHGLTIGELARMGKDAPGVLQVPKALNVSEEARLRGKLTVIPMRGWRRSMRWSETGLPWVPTSPMIQDFSAVIGYAMVGLGTYFDLNPKVKFDIGFRHGVGPQYAFRGLSHKTVKSDVIERELRALNLPGLSFRRVSVPGKDGRPETGVYVEVSDWDDWNPTELSFHLMRLACKLDPRNPFRSGDASGFLRHMGSTAFYDALKRDGAKVDVEAWIKQWQAQAKIYQQQSRRFWLYY